MGGGGAKRTSPRLGTGAVTRGKDRGRLSQRVNMGGGC